MRLQRWLFDRFRQTAGLYGFQEYSAPVLEHEDLYRRKAGEDISNQLYSFTDRDGAKVALRPEMTPSLARMVLQLMRSETGAMATTLPLKWYSVPQCWRFETTQRGRRREHYQWNMDIVGVSGIAAEVELLSAVCTFFESVGLTSDDVGLKVNSRKVLGVVLAKAGVPDDKFAEACIIIDKMDKIGPDSVENELCMKIGVSRETSRCLVQAVNAKTLDEFVDITEANGCYAVEELRNIFKLADNYGISTWLQFDASVVRGLAYYTGVVFEGFDKSKTFRAICGGGRYDKLLTLYGSKNEVPCVGFGFGDCVITELLKEKQKAPNINPSVDFVVAAYSPEMMGNALQVASKLRSGGYGVDVLPEAARKVKKAFRYADRVGARRIAFVAPGEWDQGLVRIKDLRSRSVDEDQKQKDVPIDKLGVVDEFFK